MKKCPTCEKTFEDSLRFCQVDGTPLVDDAPAFDPYATIVSSPRPAAPVAEPEEAVVVEPVAEAAAPEPEPESVMAPIAEPDNVLDLPSEDPLKTMYVSDAEMRDALGGETPIAEEPTVEMPAIEEPSATEPPAVEEFAAPEPPSFSVPDVPAPSFGETTTPPSPFAVSDVPAETHSSEPSVFDEPAPPPPPVFDEPVTAPPVFEELAPAFDEAATMIQPPMSIPFEPPAPAPVLDPPAPAPADEWAPPPGPVAEWTPPPAPDASWQNQEIGSNTPFQPPPSGTGAGENKTLAIISLVCGILSVFCCGWFIPGIAAIVMGYIAKGKATSDPANYGGAGLALGGMITGGISLVLGVIVVILYLLGFAANLMR